MGLPWPAFPTELPLDRRTRGELQIVPQPPVRPRLSSPGSRTTFPRRLPARPRRPRKRAPGGNPVLPLLPWCTSRPPPSGCGLIGPPARRLQWGRERSTRQVPKGKARQEANDEPTGAHRGPKLAQNATHSWP
eukprot:scaffold3135_cov352-Prasinococcus_capsulatus_cf.AAC.5